MYYDKTHRTAIKAAESYVDAKMVAKHRKELKRSERAALVITALTCVYILAMIIIGVGI